jgi:hypothetical protein
LSTPPNENRGGERERERERQKKKKENILFSIKL